jgi:hypothetical protein
MLISVDSMTPAQREGWHVLLDLCESSMAWNLYGQRRTLMLS